MINKKPFIEVNHPSKACWEGWEAIGAELLSAIKALDQKKAVIAVECFQGTYADINLTALKKVLSPNATCRTIDIYKSESEIRELVKKDLDLKTLSAKISTNTIDDYFDQAKLESLEKNIEFLEEGIVLIHGIGASKIGKADILVYSDMSRYEILQRFRRNDINNVGVFNENDHYELQHRWSYFIDWRICDKIKKQIIATCDYFMETNNWQKPKLASGDTVRMGFELATRQPIFMAPFFDPELWDVQSKEQLEEEEFRWGFNCDAEEDNILLKIGESLFETPAINVVYYQPVRLLGESIFRKYGSDIPVKLNFIDGTEGGNTTALGIYPGADHLMDYFGINYQQVENYYIMDVKSKAQMYIDLKEDISVEYFKETLSTGKTLDIVGLMGHMNLQKHDHLAVPQEIIHSSGHRAMMLHIGTAPSIFKTIIHARKDTSEGPLTHVDTLIDKACSSKTQKIHKNKVEIQEHPSYLEELLAVEENTQIKVSRIWFDEQVELYSNGIFQVFNLIEGEEISIEHPSGEFKPFVVHYAETFLIPASLSNFKIKAKNGQKIGLLRIMASV